MPATPPSAQQLRWLPSDLRPEINLYVVALPDTGSVHARCLFSSGGEDPATGSAAGALCAYTNQHLGRRELTISQGHEMGRPSRLNVHMDGDRPVVSGDVRLVATGEVDLA